ncbi:unnamed protein product [Rodentolepis nana]|uniref:receptor protein serine/threonine kinase n=1 Tax=Rodentolepis nana TaxID=102285 RepID=A0A158QHE9_RODNA|nr:unnamed protein product [Rodentolepis nana]
MNLTKCYCTSGQPDCDYNTRQVTCKPGQNFCFLMLKHTDNIIKVPHLQGCWYEHSINDSLMKPNVCYNISSSGAYMSCLCKGDFCNVPTIEVHLGHDVLINPDIHNQTLESPPTPIGPNPIDSIVKNPTLFYAISLPLFVLLLLIFVFIFLLCRRYRNNVNTLGASAIGGSGSSSKPKSFLSCQNLFPTLKICFTCKQSKKDDRQFNSNGGVICRFCPLNATPCAFCGKGFMTAIDGGSSMPQLVHPILGGGWLAEGEIEELSKICTKVKRCSRGRFGEVWLGHMVKVRNDDSGGNTESNPREVAIKVFPEAERKSWETELELYRLPRLKHPNILHFIGIDKITRDPSEERDDQDRSSGSECGSLTEYWLVTDYLAHGSVYDYIHSNVLSWGQMLWIAMGMARGLSYLHTELPCTATQYPKPSIAHRDFKSRNVLLKADLTPCISDLGLATRLETGRGFGDAHLQVGTARYMAPEVLDGAIQFTRDAFLRIDVYALGLVIWELMTRARPSGYPIKSDEEGMGENGFPPYMAPFEAELGPNPSMDKLQHYVAKLRNRPQPFPWWENDQAFLQLWETVQDSWDHDAEARITAGCIAGRIQNLSQRYPLSSDDPAHYLLFLASPAPLINTSGASTVVSTASSFEAPGSSSASSPHSSPIAPNPEVVPLLPTSNPPNERSTCGSSIEMFEPMITTPEESVDMDIVSSDPSDSKNAKIEEQENAIGSLRNEAVRRKERLIELRKQTLNKGLPGSGLLLQQEGDLPKPIFRNYNPISDDLKDGLLPERTMINLEVRVADQLEAAKAEAVVDEVNLFNLAPRKPDWDLKRGVEKKLKRLERRTQRVIAELIRERLKAEENSMATVEGPPVSKDTIVG